MGRGKAIGKAGLLWVGAGSVVLCMAQAPLANLQPSTECKVFICRKPGTATLKAEGVSNIQVRKLPVAYFDGSVVSLAPGDTVTLGFSKEGGKPTLVSVADDAGSVNIGGSPTSEMTLNLNLKEDGLTLILKNATGRDLQYRLARVLASENGIRTSSRLQCIHKGVSPPLPWIRTQTFLDPASLLLVGDIELLPDEPSSDCRF
jgi:hypothetical protein